MTIIGVGGEKGGVGKTCTAYNIAAWRAARLGREVYLCDTDAEPNALAWLAERPKDRPPIAGGHHPHEVPVEIFSLYDDVVIDCGAGDSDVLRDAMAFADVFVTPFAPSQLDVWKAPHVARRLAEVHAARGKDALKAYAFVMRAPTQGHRLDEGLDARRILKQHTAWRTCRTIVRDLKAFGATQPLGIGVCEYGPAGRSATKDLRALLAELGLETTRRTTK